MLHVKLTVKYKVTASQCTQPVLYFIYEKTSPSPAQDGKVLSLICTKMFIFNRFICVPLLSAGPSAGEAVLCLPLGHWRHAEGHGGFRLPAGEEVEGDHGCWKTGKASSHLLLMVCVCLSFSVCVCPCVSTLTVDHIALCW